jgi:hypothetical protein
VQIQIPLSLTDLLCCVQSMAVNQKEVRPHFAELWSSRDGDSGKLVKDWEHHKWLEWNFRLH